MSTFAELAADNPNIRTQYDEWRGLRSERGEDPLDWGAFRTHVMAIGAPDPGASPPDDFVGEDYKAANPDWTRRWYGGTAPAASAPAPTFPSAASSPAPGFVPDAIDRTSVRTGMEVVASDGLTLGQVKEVGDGDFLINRRLAQDVTVPYSEVREVSGNKITLNVPANQAGRHR